MFGTIRKHQTWLWGIIITVIIISFVWFFSPYPQMQDDPRATANLGTIYGKKLSMEDFIRAQREASLHWFFMRGEWPDDGKRGYDVERETFQWLLLVRKAEELGLGVGRDTTAEVARNMLAGLREAGITSAQVFSERVLEPQNMDLEDFERFVRHYIAIQEIVATAGLPGKLITPQEARTIYIRNNQEVSCEAVFFNASNHLASVPVSPEAIGAYYTNHLAEYRIPERLQVKYVFFNVTNLLAGTEEELSKTNLNDLVNANIERLGTNYLRFGKTPEEAKATIREQIVRETALSRTRHQAAAFAGELFDMQPVRPENLETFAKEKGLEVHTSPPFDRQSPPPGLNVGPEFARIAFARTPEEPFSAPILGRDGVYVIAMDRRLPSEVPSLENIRARVVEGYKLSEAIRLAREAGEKFSQTASNAVAQGKSFADVCKEANVTPVTLPAVSLSTRSLSDLPFDVSLDDVKQAAFGTEPGKVSGFEETANGGLVLHVKARLPLDEERLKAELPTFTAQLRQSRLNEAFNDWFSREASTELRNTPYNRPRQQPPNLGSAGS